MTHPDPLTSPPSPDAQTPGGHSAAATPARERGCKRKKVTRPSWRDVPVADPASVRPVIDNMALVMRAVYELSELDPFLLRPGERLRLRLLVDRLIGPTGTTEVGDAIRDLYVLRRRGFPMAAIQECPQPRKGRDVSREVVCGLRRAWNRTNPNKIEEALWVEKTLDFLETRSRH